MLFIKLAAKSIVVDVKFRKFRKMLNVVHICYVQSTVYDQHKVYGRSSYFINTVHSAFCFEYILFLLGWAILQKSPPKLIQSRDHHVSERGKYTLPIHIFIYIDNKYIPRNLFLTVGRSFNNSYTEQQVNPLYISSTVCHNTVHIKHTRYMNNISSLGHNI